jgi:UDP-N-acetylglucosamine/UDP-N-acetylgalactosamine 4-epimerase
VKGDLPAVVRQERRRWLVTGGAGFIGSHLVQTLLSLDQDVVVLDDFSTGHRHNLDDVKSAVGAHKWRSFRLIEGSIADAASCATACGGIDLVLHQAALGSVPRSIERPLDTHAANATGFVNMLNAARMAGVQRFVYASSSAVYGDSPELPKSEGRIGKPLSPYAVSKLTNELYADVFARSYQMQVVGLRYFNVFGPRQDPEGAYAAVIPRWAAQMLRGQACVINGDGQTSRDFCFVENVVQANLRAALTGDPAAINRVYNIAVGDRTTLLQLHEKLAAALQEHCPGLQVKPALHQAFRVGDVTHSLASIEAARNLLNYSPTQNVAEGLWQTAAWYAGRVNSGS